MCDSNIQVFKSKFCQWARNYLSEKSYSGFSRSLTQIIKSHIPESDYFLQFRIMKIKLYKPIKINLNIDFTIVRSSKVKNNLSIGALMPSWERGVRKYCPNENIYDVISWFLHFSSQYIHRARLINIKSAIILVWDIPSSFNGQRISSYILKNNHNLKQEMINKMNLYEKPNNFSIGLSKQKILLYWLKRINSLDPYINRMFYHFITAHKLSILNFGEELITSLDKTIDVVIQYGRARIKTEINDSNKENLLKQLGMTQQDIRVIKFINSIRNMFGAHPSDSMWWNFYENFSDDIDIMFKVVKSFVKNVVLHESTNRVVQSRPNKWSTWFKQNIEMLWNAVWFERMNKNLIEFEYWD